MKSSLAVAAMLVLVSAAATLAATGPSVSPTIPGEVVPTWVFYWVLGLASFAGAVLLTIIKILWDRGSVAQDRSSTLTEEEKGWLRQLYHWHKVVDDNQVPVWYVPRPWAAVFERLQTDHTALLETANRLVEHHEGMISSLREDLKESRGLQMQQQVKMLKLAVRVQRAVEALAGLQPPEIEDDLDDER